MFKHLCIISSVVILTACSTKNDVAMNEAYHKYNSSAEWKRMDTIAKIAAQGDSGVVAAAMLMQSRNVSGPITAQPTSTGDKVLNTVAALSPTIIGLGQIAATVDGNRTNKEIAVVQSNNNKDISINNSDNNATVTMHTNDTMADIAEVTIINPAVVETTTTTTNTTTTNN